MLKGVKESTLKILRLNLIRNYTSVENNKIIKNVEYIKEKLHN